MGSVGQYSETFQAFVALLLVFFIIYLLDDKVVSLSPCCYDTAMLLWMRQEKVEGITRKL